MSNRRKPEDASRSDVRAVMRAALTPYQAGIIAEARENTREYPSLTMREIVDAVHSGRR